MKSAIEPIMAGGSTKIGLIFHERSGRWAAGLKAEFAALGVRPVETRSRAALLEAAACSSAAIVLIEVGPDPERSLRDLAALTTRGGDLSVLVLGAEARADVCDLAYELGATLATSEAVPRPVVAALLSRWVALAARRASREGWSAPTQVSRIEAASTIEEILAATSGPAIER